jgi:glucosylceramidase
MRAQMLSSTRRKFLKTTGATASLAAFRSSLLWAAPATGVQAWSTSKDRKFEPIKAPQWHAATTNSSGGIQLDPAVRYQKILGFGAAFTDASCYWFAKLNAPERQALLSEFFGPAGLRLSVCRTCIGSSDYSTSAYSFDDSPEPDPELKKFSI